MEKSCNLTNKFLILMNQRCYAAAFQNPTKMYVDIEVMEFFDTVMEKSWNFVVKISWQPCMSASPPQGKRTLLNTSLAGKDMEYM